MPPVSFVCARATGTSRERAPASASHFRARPLARAGFELPALVYGDRITVDFSPKGGPSGLTGTLVADGIKWPDGNKWPKIEKK